MPKKRFSAEQIVILLRQIEVLITCRNRVIVVPVSGDAMPRMAVPARSGFAYLVPTRIGQVSKAFVEAVRRSLLSNQDTPSESTSNARATPQVSYAIPVPLVGRVRVGAVSARSLFRNFTDESLPPLAKPSAHPRVTVIRLTCEERES